MRRRRKRDEWRRLVAEWERSGARAEEFAGQVGVHAKTLQVWKYKLRRSLAEARGVALAKIVEVRPSLSAADERFEVRLVGGRRIAVPPSFDGETLARLLRVLEEAP